jgi:formylglycine-generating enzyme required for sulfatase activity
MYPIVVQTEFTAPGVKVENPETNKVFSLIPGNWNAVWTVTKGAVSTDPLQILVDAQKKIAGQTGLDTLKLKAKSATGDPLLGLGSLDGNVYTVGVGDYGLQQVGTAGYANFKLEYVPFGVFDDTAWAGFDGVGKIDGVPKWIIRNGINDAVQDTQTAFGNPNSWGGTANGNGAVPWVIAVKTPGGGGSGGGGGGGSTLEVKVDSYDWTGAKPTVGFTTDGYDDGDAEAYYVVVGKDTGAPSGYAGYTQFPGTFAPGAHPGNEITLGGGQTGNTYDVYVVIYKDGAVSDPAKITITKGSKVTIIPTWGAEVEPPEMVQVAGGTFTMGHKMSGNNTDNPNEKPEHDVTLSGFWMGKYEVTQKEWEAVMGSNPSAAGHKGDNIPVEFVSWYDAVAYCNELSEIEGLTKAYVINGEEVTCNFSASGYRLPTEAEWEYAAKGGANKDTYRYSGGNTLDNVAWHMYNADAKPHPVGEKSPNSLGLYDMTGNAWEFCWDWIGDYESSSQENPKGADMGEKRVYRGGCVGIDLDYLELTYRGSVNPSNKSYVVGFRLARSL